MKATLLLEKQHRKVEALFEAIESSKANAQLIGELATSLTAHAVIEEEIFYPVARRFLKEMVLESYEEHELVAYGLKRLVATDPDDESFAARVTVVKELVAHHVKEEEQDMLPAVSDALEEEENEQLGKEMRERFEALEQAGYDRAVAILNGHRGAKNGHSGKGARRKAYFAPPRAS